MIRVVVERNERKLRSPLHDAQVQALLVVMKAVLAHDPSLVVSHEQTPKHGSRLLGQDRHRTGIHRRRDPVEDLEVGSRLEAAEPVRPLLGQPVDAEIPVEQAHGEAAVGIQDQLQIARVDTDRRAPGRR
jgi:hypothetical protein